MDHTQALADLRARWAGMIPVAEADGERGMAQDYASAVQAIDLTGDPARAARLLRASRPDTVLAGDLDELAAKHTIPEPPNGTVVVLHYGANNYDCYEVITRDDTTEGAHGNRRWRHADDRPEMPRAWADWCADADTIHALGPQLTEKAGA